MANEYNVYRGQDGDMDYVTPVATMNLNDTSVEISSQDLPPNTVWHYTRRRVADDCLLESDPSDPCVVRIDADGDMIASAPNDPLALASEAQADGTIKLRWRYMADGQEVAPTGFYVYVDSGSGFDFDTPDATVLCDRQVEYEWTSSDLNDGQSYSFVVRAYAAAGGQTQNTAKVTATARSTGPAAASSPWAITEDA